MLTFFTLAAVIVPSELKQGMSYSPSCLFADVLVSDGSVSGSFITFGPAAAQTALGDSCLSPVEARSGGDPTPPLTSLLLL